MGWLSRMSYRAIVKGASRSLRHARRSPLSELRDVQDQVHIARLLVSELYTLAERRLALPVLWSDKFPRPRGTDWSWRPELWRGPLHERGIVADSPSNVLSHEVALFHDCNAAEVLLRQVRNTGEADLAAFGLVIEVFQFSGSYLSTAITLPAEACQGLLKRHLVRVDTVIDMESPREIYARLNIQHGPNVEQLVRELPKSGSQTIEFDLAYSDLNEKRIEKIWLDLIFDRPHMNRIVVRDLTFCRYPRAEL